MNNITIIGRLTRDPEYTPKSGDKSQYVKFTVAVDNRYGDLTTFFDCIVFGYTADNVNKFISKGRMVAVRGRMEQGDQYLDKNGNKRRSWTLRADEVKFLDRPQKNEATLKPEDTGDSWDQLDDDVPF